MPAGPITVDQGTRRGGPRGADVPKVDDQPPRPVPDGRVDQDLTKSCRIRLLHVAPDPDHRCARTGRVGPDRRSAGGRRHLGPPASGLVVDEAFAKLAQNATQQSRHVHLGHAERPGDLVLGDVAEEVARDDVLLAVREPTQQLPHRQAVAGRVQSRIGGTDQFDPFPGVVVAPDGRVQRADRVRRAGGPSRPHVLLGAAQCLAQFGVGRRASESLSEGHAGPGGLQMSLLQTARDVQAPAPVAEVLLELAEHGRHQIAEERFASPRVEAVDRLHQSQSGDLTQILGRLSTLPVAAGEAGHERQVDTDDLVADVETIWFPGRRVVQAAEQYGGGRIGLLAGRRWW